MKYILFFKLFLFSTILFSQCDGRYESEIFNEVNKTIVEYTDVYDWSVFDSGLDMDIYQPSNDTTTNRPLLIFAHGGTFVAGNKNNPTMVSLCEAFAKRGYVTASIQYRLTSALNLLLPNAYDIFSQTVLNAVSDMKAAVRFFRKDFFENGNTYGINPNQIFVGGNSAGGPRRVLRNQPKSQFSYRSENRPANDLTAQRGLNRTYGRLGGRPSLPPPCVLLHVQRLHPDADKGFRGRVGIEKPQCSWQRGVTRACDAPEVPDGNPVSGSGGWHLGAQGGLP